MTVARLEGVEESLRRALADLQRAQEIARVGSYRLDLPGGLYTCTPVLDRILGIDPSYPHTAEGWLALVHPEEREAMGRYLADEVIGKRSIFDRQYRVVRPADKKVRWIHGRGLLELGSDGAPLVLHGTAHDITEAKARETELTRLVSDTEAMGQVGSWELDLDTRTVKWTAGIRRIHELGPDFEPTLETALSFYTPESRPVIERAIRRIMDRGEPFDLTLEIVTAKGNRRSVHAVGDIDRERRRAFGFFQDVTAFRRAEREREQFQRFFEASADMMCMADPNGAFKKINPAFTEALGYSEEELISKPFVEFVVPEDRQATLDEMARQQKIGSTLWFENRYLCKDGSAKWLAWRAKYVAAEGVTYAIARDVTGSKRTSESLAKTARALRTLSRSGRAILRAGGEQELLSMTCEAVAEEAGYPLAWVGYRTDDAEKSIRVMAQAGRGRDYLKELRVTWADEETGRGPTGTAIRTNSVVLCADIRTDPRMRPWRDEALKHGYISSIALPLSAGEQALGAIMIYSPDELGQDEVELLRELSENLSYGIASLRVRDAVKRTAAYNRTLIEASLDPLVTIGPDGGITDVNRATELATGVGREKLIGTDFCEYFTEPERARAGYRKAFQEGAVKNYRLDIRGRDGTLTPVLYNATVYRDEKGEVLGLFAAARDMTESARAEREILKLNAELEERVARRTTQLEAANKELEAFAYSVSHDLRAPLRSIDGFSQILVEDYGPKLDPECLRYLGLVRRGAQVMGRLIDDLLAFSRLGRQAMARSFVSMDEVVRAAFESVAEQRQGRRLDVRIGELGSCRGDFALLKQVWINLLGNAVKFTAKREEALIEIDAREENGETVYRIKDNGAGFDMRFADKLFKVFSRLHSRQQFEGTGVGLAIVARIIERHGGRVWARGEVDRGAEFFFTLGGGEP